DARNDDRDRRRVPRRPARDPDAGADVQEVADVGRREPERLEADACGEAGGDDAEPDGRPREIAHAAIPSARASGRACARAIASTTAGADDAASSVPMPRPPAPSPHR